MPRIGFWKGKRMPKYLREKLSLAAKKRFSNPKERLEAKTRMREVWKRDGYKSWYFSQAKPRKPRISSGGYFRVYMPKHPSADKKGYVIEQRIVMEQFLGRPLQSYEIVHHKNHDKHDNRTENLQVTTHSEHAIIHSRRFHKPYIPPKKISDQKVAEIRASYDGTRGLQTKLAKEYGVSQQYIYDIISGRRRKRI